MQRKAPFYKHITVFISLAAPICPSSTSGSFVSSKSSKTEPATRSNQSKSFFTTLSHKMPFQTSYSAACRLLGGRPAYSFPIKWFNLIKLVKFVPNCTELCDRIWPEINFQNFKQTSFFNIVQQRVAHEWRAS